MKLMLCDNAGYANYTYKLCNAIVEVDDSLDIVYLTDNNNLEIDKISSSVHIDCSVCGYKKNLRKFSFRWVLDRFALPVRIILSRNKAIKKHSPDVLVLQSYIPILDQYLLKCISRNTRIVLTVHNVIPHEKTPLWSKHSLARVYRNADHLIVHTDQCKRELINDFGIIESKISVTNIGTDLTYNKLDCNECRKKIGINDDKIILLLYGGIRDYKGLDILLPALNGIRCHIVIAGELCGETSFLLYEEMIKTNKLSARCFIERVSDEFTDVLFQACDFVVLPYKAFTAQSGVLMQAIKYEKPVIATDVGVFKSIVEEYHIGYICKPNSVVALSECIKKAVMNGVETGSHRGVAQYFSWENSAKKYIEVINE